MTYLRLTVFLLLLITALALLYFGAAWFWAIIALVGSVIPTLIRQFVWPMIIEVLGGKAEKNTPDTLSQLRTSWLNPINLLSSWRIRKHLNEQTEIIRRMPFVFEDVLGIEDLLENFIDIRATNLDLKTFKPKPVPPTSIKKFADILRDNKKAILLGDGGTGKTTFQRHTALTIIKDRSKVPYLESNEKVVPFYIQLRLIDNSDPFPIRRHLLDKTTYSAGPRGRKRLIKLAKEGRLFLFLDGYDETPFSLMPHANEAKTTREQDNHERLKASDGRATENSESGTTAQINYLQEELKLVLSPNMARIGPCADRPQVDVEFYKLLQGCRVWLTCRKNYFRDQTPFTIYEIPTTQLAAFVIHGVDNRKNLIQKVFDRYKLIQDNKHLFKADLFFNMINRDVGELKALSDNPLLLIIICRLYAYEVVKTGNPRVQIANTLDTIIEKYFELLLEGLDKGRNRGLGLSVAEEEWQREGRGLYTNVKREFLKYFASQLYVENIGGFTKEYIYARATEFFDQVHFEHTQEILEGLRQRPALTDFVGQIINLEIVVETGEEERKKNLYYDFPHQRFRELLAAQYFDSNGYSYILQNLQRTALNELLYVFFRITSHKDAVIEELLNQIAADARQAESYLTIFSRCLHEAPEYSPNDAFRIFLSKRLDVNLPFEIPKGLRHGFEDGRYFIPDYPFRQRLARCLSEGGETVSNSMRLSGELLLIYEKSLLRFVLENYFTQSGKKHSEEAYSFRSDLMHRCDQKALREFFPSLFRRYVDQSDGHNLNLCCQFIGSHDVPLLKELFISTLRDALKYAAASKDFVNPPPAVLLLLGSNKEILNDVIGDYLLKSLRDNDFLPVHQWLVDLYKPAKNFTPDWASAMRESLDAGRLYPLWLAVELGMRSEVGLESQAQHLLIPALIAGNHAMLQLVAISSHINKFLNQACHGDEGTQEILNLVSIYDRLILNDLGAVESLTIPPRYCHIITYRTIRELQGFTQEHAIDVGRKDWVRIYKLTYRVLLDSELTSHLPKSLDKKVAEKLIELTRTSYDHYDVVMKSMSEFDTTLPRADAFLK